MRGAFSSSGCYAGAHPMEPIPALDLSRGRVVRLLRGERGRETAYGDDPLRAASEFAAAGARWLHVVDLDAAFGDGGNRETVRRLLAESPLLVQVAGGVRSLASFDELREAGAARVVFGTTAVEAPRVVEEAIRRDREGVAVALDVRQGRLRTRGWVRAGGAPEDAARRWGECGAATIIHTGVERDGTMEGAGCGGRPAGGGRLGASHDRGRGASGSCPIFGRSPVRRFSG